MQRRHIHAQTCITRTFFYRSLKSDKRFCYRFLKTDKRFFIVSSKRFLTFPQSAQTFFYRFQPPKLSNGNGFEKTVKKRPERFLQPLSLCNNYTVYTTFFSILMGCSCFQCCVAAPVPHLWNSMSNMCVFVIDGAQSIVVYLHMFQPSIGRQTILTS